MIHFCLVVDLPQMFSKPFVTAVYLKYISTACALFAFIFSKSPSLYLIMYPLFLVQIPNTQVCLFTELCSRKTRFCHAHRTFLQVQLQQEGVQHRNISIHKHKLLFTTYTAFSIDRFVYLVSLASHLCRVYLFRKDNKATVEVYAADEIHSFPRSTSTKPEIVLERLTSNH